MQTIEQPFKRGSTFRLAFRVKDPVGVDIDVATWTIRSTLRTLSGKTIQDLTVATVLAETGLVELTATATETALWPKGKAVFDIQLLDNNGDTFPTEDVSLTISEGPTRA